MADVDSLSIEIEANAKQAAKNLDALTNSVKGLSRAVSGNSLDNLGKLASSLQNISAIGNNLNGVKNFANAMNRLAKSTKDIDTTGLGKMMSTVDKLGNSLSKVNVSGAARLTGALARLGNAGEKVELTNKSLPQLTNTIKNFATAMARTEQISVEVVQLTSALAKLASAGAKAQQSAASLDTLGKEVESVIARLSKAPQVSANTSQLVYGLGNLASAGASGRKALDSLYGSSGRSSSMLSKLGNIARGTGKAISGMGRQTSLSNKGILGMANSIAMLAGRYWVLIAGLRKGAQAIGSAMDYVETLNYFNNTLDTMGNRANEKWQEIGFSSAEEYASSFRDRAETLLGKMSGFKIGDSGNLEMTGMQNLGVDPDQLMNYSSVFSQMANSLGLATTNASKLGQVLPEIGADMASLYNKDFTEVWDDLQSGITGMARTWDKYGTNIRVANMEQYAATNGLNVNVKTMSQADKVLLRTIMLLDSQRNAWTDLAKTINQPRNQLRMLQASFTNLARSIGSIFMPIVAAVLPYLNAIMVVLNKAANAVANFVSALTGYKPSDLTGSVAKDSGIGDIVEDTEDYGKAANNAAKATKEWQNQLMGFDEVNKLEDSSGGNDGGSGGGGGVSGGGSGLQGAFDSILEEYQKAWDNAYTSMSNKAQQMAQQIETAFKNAWKNEDGSELGGIFAGWINKAIGYAQTFFEKKNEIINKLAKILGTAINQAVKDINWKDLGKVIGTAIKGQLEAAETFMLTVNWTQAGKALGKTINGIVDSGVVQQAFKTLAANIKAAIELALGTITEIKWKDLGKAIAEGINNFLNTMNQVNPETGLNGWQELGKTITDGIKGVATALSEAIKGVKWDEVGEAIGDVLSEIKWLEVLKSVGTTIAEALKGAIIAGIGMWKKAPIETAIGVIIGGIALKKVGKKLATKLVSKFGIELATKKLSASSVKTFASGVITKIGNKFSSTKLAGKLWTCLKNACPTAASKITTTGLKPLATGFVKKFNAALAAAFVGWSIGQAIYNANSEKIDKGTEDFLSGKKGGALGKATGTFVVHFADFIQFDIPEHWKELEDACKKLANKVESAVKAAMKGIKWLFGDNTDKSVGSANSNTGGGSGTSFGVGVKVNVDDADAKDQLKSLTDEKRTAKVSARATNIKNTNLKLNKLQYDPDKTEDTARTADISANATDTASTTKTLDKVANPTGKGKDGKDGRKAKITPTLTTKNLKVGVTPKLTAKLSDLQKNWQSYLDSHPLKFIMKPDGTKLEIHYEKTAGNSVMAYATRAANGGLFKNGKHLPITRFASGGLPNQGQMFIAREAGAELVGRLGNSTAVMNNDQIVASVAKGVQSAVEVGMRNAIGATSGRNTPQYVQADISIDGRKVMESVLAQARTVSLENNGANVFMSI